MKYGNVELHNVCDLIEDDGLPGVGTLRLPRAILEAINPGARNMARMGGGCEIRGMLPEGGEAKVTLQVVDDNTTPPVVSVYHGCFCGQTICLRNSPTTIVVRHPDNYALMKEIARKNQHAFDPALIRICLPPIHTPRILSVEGELTYPTAGAIPETTLLCYGSSITHGACAVVPEGSYAMQCARQLGCNLINLGVGGSAQMDFAIAEHIACRDDWDMALFEMGINVRTWPLDQFRTAVERFLKTVVSAHPDRYIFCIDLFLNDCDFMENPTKGVGFREVVRELVAACESRKVIYLDGRTILTDPTGLRTDLVHPTDQGMQEMGANLASVMSKYIAG